MIQRRKKLFLTLWFSYLLILFIPVSIFAVLYTNIEQLMVKNANRSNLAMLEQARQAVDTQMQEINRLTSQIATQPKLQTLWNIRENDRYVEYSEAVNILKNIRSGSTFAGNYYIQLAESDLILSPSLKTDTSTYLNKISTYADKDEAWVRSHVLSGYHFQTFWPSASIIENSLNKNVITCAVSLPLGERANVRATLVILIDEEQIFNILKQIEWASSGRIYILDDRNQVIMSSVGDRTLPEGVLPEVSGSPQYRTIELDGNSMMLSSTAGTSGWKYLSLVPEEVVLKRVNQIKQWAYLVLAAALAAGSAAAGWMAYRNYSPIRDMVTALLNGRSETAPISGNEYEFIQSSITATLAEGKQLKQRLEEHTPVVRAHFLTRLLKGQADPDAFKESSLEFMGLRFPHDGICVVLIEVDDLSEFGKEDTEREWALARFILINLSSELIGDSGYVTETDRNRFAILMNVADDSEETRLRRDEFVSQLKQVVEGRFRLKITAAASSIRMGLPEAGRCYAEALEALDYRIIHGISSYIHFDEIRQPGGGFYQYPMETEVQLTNLMKSGDASGVEALLDDIYRTNERSQGMTPEMSKCLFFDLLGTVLKVLHALKLDGKELFADTGDPVKLIMSSHSAEDMLRRIKELAVMICSIVCEAKSDQSDRLNEQIKQYLEEKYADNGLSLTSIADHFGVTAPYVSGFFKKQNNMNLTDYLVAIRIREAKHLLSDPRLTVLQVAQMVGYATDIGFIRVFKKQEGVTPGKFREIALRDKQADSG